MEDLKQQDLEKQLQIAFAREEPPAWFEAKVMAAAARERRPWWRRVFTGGKLRLAVAVAAAGLVTSGVIWQHENARQREFEDRRAGMAAKARLELALQITRAKLEKVQRRLREIQTD